MWQCANQMSEENRGICQPLLSVKRNQAGQHTLLRGKSVGTSLDPGYPCGTHVDAWHGGLLIISALQSGDTGSPERAAGRTGQMGERWL